VHFLLSGAAGRVLEVLRTNEFGMESGRKERVVLSVGQRKCKRRRCEGRPVKVDQRVHNCGYMRNPGGAAVESLSGCKDLQAAFPTEWMDGHSAQQLSCSLPSREEGA